VSSWQEQGCLGGISWEEFREKRVRVVVESGKGKAVTAAVRMINNIVGI
jgi:hypothetical protein